MFNSRVTKTLCLFIVIFFLAVLVGYLFVPEGALKDINAAVDSKTEVSLINNTLSILFRNTIIICACCVGNVVAICTSKFIFPMGYLGVGSMFIINGITLGSWSFVLRDTPRPEFIYILLHPFDIIHNAGLLEMLAVALIVSSCGLLNYFRIVDGKININKRLKLSRGEGICIGIGILLLISASVIESIAIYT